MADDLSSFEVYQLDDADDPDYEPKDRDLRGIDPDERLKGLFTERCDHLIIFLGGSLDAYSDPSFLEFFFELDGLFEEQMPLVVDITRLEFIDSAGMGALCIAMGFAMGKHGVERTRPASLVATGAIAKIFRSISAEFWNLQPDLVSGLENSLKILRYP